MDNNGCLVALLSSVKLLLSNLERDRDAIGKGAYEESRAELLSMRKLLESLIRGPRKS